MERTLEDLVWKRARGRCEYCQVSSDELDLPFEIDHIIALKMNLEHRIDLRQGLVDEGVFPPG